jgi:serine/threonine protein kinase
MNTCQGNAFFTGFLMASAAIEAGYLIDQCFRVESLLGQGGFGAVYRCRDLRNDSLVTVKLLRSFMKGKGTSPLHSEFSILRRLRHPNLARIIDFGRIDGSGSLYIAQEYVEGKNLFVATADKEVRQVVEILAELCRTVQFLHDHGVIHGDLKPGNVLIANQADSRDRLKVLDFGLAQWLTGEEKPPAAGMLAYIAPEVLMGQRVVPQSDLYSLGILF